MVEFWTLATSVGCSGRVHRSLRRNATCPSLAPAFSGLRWRFSVSTLGWVIRESGWGGRRSACTSPSDLCPSLQIEQLYVRQLVEEAGKTCGTGSMVPPPEDPQPDQVFRMFPDICASHQRPFFRENQQITV